MTLEMEQKPNMEEIKSKAQIISGNISGYVGTKVMNLGLRLDLFDALSKNDSAVTAAELADQLDYDEVYTKIWLDAAYSFEFVEVQDDEEDPKFELAQHIDKLVLNENFPSYMGGFTELVEQKELFDNFEEHIVTGERIWWDDVRPEWIEQVSKTTFPNYTRMIMKDFEMIPGLEEKLEEGANVLELASGTAKGLSKFAHAYPSSEFVGLDGDEYSIEYATNYVKEQGLEDRISFIHSTFEDLGQEDMYDVIVINASMHECRDINKVTKNVYRALKSDGIFVISDIPFPEDYSEYRTTPSQIMLGINFFESQIDDVLLPTNTYKELLETHGFANVDAFNSTPTQCLVFGYKN